ENLTRSHRRHLYQLLVNEFGIVHWKVSTAYAVAQLIIGGGALIAYPYGVGAVLTFLTICFALFVFLTAGVRKRARSASHP
ncbi:MAG: UDP-N-acetylmuramyl pentapeptide phosphotransferase, partial [Proteobacteria bacterium]|nr:UDP-N-acetylmuramyl pentapeptide phosphotransferase [Pseudomonadota bacterium]